MRNRRSYSRTTTVNPLKAVLLFLLFSILPVYAQEREDSDELQEETDVISAPENEEILLIIPEDEGTQVIFHGDTENTVVEGTESSEKEVFITIPDEGEIRSDESDPQRIVIRGERVHKSPFSTSSHITTISAEEIQASAARTLADLLSPVLGLRLSRSGGPAEPAFVSIRGSSPEQVLVLIDGKRLNSAQGGGVDLSDIDPEAVERVEISRGGGSSIYGENALGGVVNIVLKDGSTTPREAHLSASWGSFNTLRGNASLNGSSDSGRTGWFLALSGMRTDGGYSFTDIRTPEDSDTRENADGWDTDIAMKLTAELLPSLQLAAAGQGHWGEEGVPGLPEFPSPGARMKDGRILAMLSLSRESENSRLDTEASVLHHHRRYTDPENPLGAINDTHENLAVSGRMEYRRQDSWAGTALMSSGGGSLRRDSLNSTALIRAGEEGEGSISRLQISGFLHSDVTFSPLTLSPSFRLDSTATSSPDGNSGTPDSAFSWNLGGTVPLNHAQSAVLKTNTGTAYRAPSFDDLFWPSSAFAVGNPELKAEKAFIVDAGFLMKPVPWISLEAVFFHHKVRDLIQWTAGPSGRWRPSNIGQAVLYGVEAETRAFLDLAAINSWGEVVLNATGLHPEDRTPDSAAYGMILPGRPQLTINGILSLSHLNGHSFRMEGRYAGLRYITARNTKAVEPYFVLDAALNWQASENWSIRFSARNLLNREYIDIRDYPVPGIELNLETHYTSGGTP